jgi:hypothetical protein
MHYTGYGSRINCLNLTFLHGCGGALSIDSPTPISTPDLKKHPLDELRLCYEKCIFYIDNLFVLSVKATKRSSEIILKHKEIRCNY